VAAALAEVLSEPEMLLSKLEEVLKIRERERGVAGQSRAAPREVPVEDMAIQRFSFWMARGRTLFGLSRRVMAGRSMEVRSLIDQSLCAHGIPLALADAVIDRLSAPRLILGLACRRTLAGADAVQGLIARLVQEHVRCLTSERPRTASGSPQREFYHFFKKKRRAGQNGIKR
jgi:hypothetical protein